MAPQSWRIALGRRKCILVLTVPTIKKVVASMEKLVTAVSGGDLIVV